MIYKIKTKETDQPQICTKVAFTPAYLKRFAKNVLSNVHNN